MALSLRIRIITTRIRQQIDHAGLRIIIERCIKRGGVLRQGQHILHIFHRTIDQVSNIFRCRITTIVVLCFQMIFRTQNLIKLAHHMHRQTHCARLIHDGALNTLTNPPGGIGRKTETAFRLEFVNRPHQAQITFLNQIEQSYATVDVMLGDRDDQTKIVLNHLLA